MILPEIDHGPPTLLKRFFEEAQERMDLLGVTLRLGSVGELMRMNLAHRDSWLPLTSTFRDIGGAIDDNTLVFIGLDTRGEPVATQAVRLFDWRHRNFRAEAESLRFFYADPRSAAPNERCTVTAPEAADITGRVALGGAIWYRPDFRRIDLGDVMPRFCRAYAYSRMGFDMLIATITQDNIDKRLDARTGHINVIRSAMIMRHSITAPDGDLHLAIATLSPADIVDQAFMFLND